MILGIGLRQGPRGVPFLFLIEKTKGSNPVNFLELFSAMYPCSCPASDHLSVALFFFGFCSLNIGGHLALA